NAFVVAVGPVGQTAIRLRAAYSAVELPQELARRGIQREDFLGGSDSIENSSDDERIRLEAAFFLRVKAPCNSQVLDVAPVDLRKRRIVIVLRSAAIRRPILLFLVGRSVLWPRSEEHTSELQSRFDLVCRLLL